MSALKFEQDDQGRDTKVGLGMYSKDGEYVELESHCDLSGQVKNIHENFQILCPI